jgi:hypothetical protein
MAFHPSPLPQIASTRAPDPNIPHSQSTALQTLHPQLAKRFRSGYRKHRGLLKLECDCSVLVSLKYILSSYVSVSLATYTLCLSVDVDFNTQFTHSLFYVVTGHIG